ncbi:hypothetical protein XA68_15596 [Ophiocordyceps unilateralis]|uniref:Small ribosomal subunit protein bS18m n=1 Tax=Ophiocordyceps unilateralis TaxID=268505 RepID=A0A2A9P7W7_OPHUN|nr:hypothetical protein XA68_15596 [Ophiocordyceps unilateralis]
MPPRLLPPTIRALTKFPGLTRTVTTNTSVYTIPSPQAGHNSSSSTRLSNLGAQAKTPPGGPPTRGPPGHRAAHRFLVRAVEQTKQNEDIVKSMSKKQQAEDLHRRMPRRFDPGEVYSPHDLSPVEMWKWRRRTARRGDVVDALGLRPLDMYKNFSLIQDFTTSSGQIQPASVTGLRPVNQRKIAKMVRRVQGMGIYPTIHDHPEALRARFFGAESSWEDKDDNR